MKVFRLNKLGVRGAAIVICLLVLYMLLEISGSMLSGEPTGAAAGMRQYDDAQVRSRLLMEAIHQVGTCDPVHTALLWASGLKNRSAALQYAAMDEDLKAEYAAQLETSAPNWVTGQSSPWVEDYRLLEVQSPNEDVRIVRILFSTATSTGPYADYQAELKLVHEGMFWRIVHIIAEEGLYPYTRLHTA
ncbi:MAG: hypothetical protein ACOYJC_11135 [Christensenellales bacterium]|jgi:hypothetical protein